MRIEVASATEAEAEAKKSRRSRLLDSCMMLNTQFQKKKIENCDKQLIKQVDIFDIYSGKNIDDGKKSVALRVVIQPIEKTLTSEEIEVLSKKIIETVQKNHDAILRSV